MCTVASKKKKNKKKNKAAKDKTNGDTTDLPETNGHDELPEQDNDDGEADETDTHTEIPAAVETQPPAASVPSSDLEKHDPVETTEATESPPTPAPAAPPSPAETNGSRQDHEVPIATDHDHVDDEVHLSKSISDTDERLAAAARERDELKAEVTELRKSLESIQQRHQDEMDIKQAMLEKTQSGKEHAETQYKNLLGKVNTIKAQLGERLKADAVGLTISSVSSFF